MGFIILVHHRHRGVKGFHLQQQSHHLKGALAALGGLSHRGLCTNAGGLAGLFPGPLFQVPYSQPEGRVAPLPTSPARIWPIWPLP